MNPARKYDRTLRRWYSFRAVWLPGTEKAGGAVVLRLFRVKRNGKIY
ncbi:MAG: hypothetical protein WD577_06495 [Bacteroidales bacterium]